MKRIMLSLTVLALGACASMLDAPIVQFEGEAPTSRDETFVSLLQKGQACWSKTHSMFRTGVTVAVHTTPAGTTRIQVKDGGAYAPLMTIDVEDRMGKWSYVAIEANARDRNRIQPYINDVRRWISGNGECES